jgi:ubiquilin
MTDINVKIKTTYSPEVKTITIKSDCNVEDIMKEIEKFSSIPPSGQKLIFKGKILNPAEPISNYKIENDVTLIMVKTAAKPQESNSGSNSQPSQPSTTENVSSNTQDNITVKVKTNIDATIHDVSINKSATVLGLKGEIEKVAHIPASQQRLVIKGKTMKDSEPLSTYNIANDSTIAMIKLGGEGEEHEEMPNPGGEGGFNLGQLGQMNPEIASLLNNPAMLEQIMNTPEMRNLIDSSPQIREAFQNPVTRQLLLQRILQESNPNQPRRAENPFGQINLTVSQNPNPRLGECFSKWMDDEKNGRNTGLSQQHEQPPSQPRPQAVYQQMPQPDPNVDYKEKYKDQIAQIKEMGIDDEEKIIEALKQCDGNVQYALNRLFG